MNTTEALLSSLERENYGRLCLKKYHKQQTFSFAAISDDAGSELLSIHD